MKNSKKTNPKYYGVTKLDFSTNAQTHFDDRKYIIFITLFIICRVVRETQNQNANKPEADEETQKKKMQLIFITRKLLHFCCCCRSDK